MKKYRTCLLAFGALLCLGLSGCGEDWSLSSSEGDQVQSTAYSIYYVNGDGTELVRSAYEPGEETQDVMIQEILQNLKEQTPQGGNQALLPKGVTINTYEIQEKTITIDFSMDYHKMDADREVLVRAGIVRMFLQVPGIVYVEFTVGNQELQDSKGNVIGPMTNDTFVEQSGKDINSYQYTTLTLYFTNEAGDALVPERRSVYYNGNVSLERVVLEQLLAGPKEAGAYPTLPGTADVLGVTREDKNCYVNLDKDFVDEALAVQEQIPIYSIVNSLADACKVKKVQISVNGETDMVFRETMDLNQFYKKSKKLIQEAEEAGSAPSEAPPG